MQGAGMAQAAAARDAAPASSPDVHQLVLVSLDGHRYGLLAADVREVQRMVAVLPLPAAPDVIEGVFDLRGRLVPVLDARQRFGLAPKPIEPSDRLVIATAGPRTVALRVDAALELVEVPSDHVDTATSSLPGVKHVDGVAQDDEGLVVVHDLTRFLSLEEGRLLDGALAASDGP